MGRILLLRGSPVRYPIMVLDSIQKCFPRRSWGWLPLVLLFPLLLGSGEAQTESSIKPGLYTGRYIVRVMGEMDETEFFVDIFQRGKIISGVSYYSNGVFDISGSAGEEDAVLDIVFYFTISNDSDEESRVLLLGHASDVTAQVNSFVGTIFTEKNAAPFVAIRIADYDSGEDDPCEDGDPDCFFRVTDRLPLKDLRPSSP